MFQASLLTLKFVTLYIWFLCILQIAVSFSPSSIFPREQKQQQLNSLIKQKTTIKIGRTFQPLGMSTTPNSKSTKSKKKTSENKNDISPPPFADPLLSEKKKTSSKRSKANDTNPPPFLKPEKEMKKSNNAKAKSDYTPPKFKYDPNEFADMFKDPYGNDDVEGDLTNGNGGVMKEIISKGEGTRVQDGAEVTVNYVGRIANHPQKMTFAKGKDYTFIQKDGTMISGWEIALGTMKVGEKARIICSPKYAYGRDGIPPVISATDSLEFEFEVKQSVGNFLTPKNAAELDPLKLRTPKDIAKDFADRTKQRELANAEKTNFELAKEWVDKLYFFGFFEGATGEKVPIYLQPLVTFPIIFALVGVAFYILYIGGGISLERDAPTQEELDASLGVAYTFTNNLKLMS